MAGYIQYVTPCILTIRHSPHQLQAPPSPQISIGSGGLACMDTLTADFGSGFIYANLRLKAAAFALPSLREIQSNEARVSR